MNVINTSYLKKDPSYSLMKRTHKQPLEVEIVIIIEHLITFNIQENLCSHYSSNTLMNKKYNQDAANCTTTTGQILRNACKIKGIENDVCKCTWLLQCM